MSQYKCFKVEVAQRRRICLHCGEAIPKGEACLKFTFNGRSGPQSVNANICRSCLVNIQEEIYQTNMGTLKNKFQDLLSKQENKQEVINNENCNC